MATTEKDVARQLKIVALLENDGLSSEAARERLHDLEATLASHRADQDEATVARDARSLP